MLWIIFGIISFILTIIALFKITSERNIENKTMWVIIILFLPISGSILFFINGMKNDDAIYHNSELTNNRIDKNKYLGLRQVKDSDIGVKAFDATKDGAYIGRIIEFDNNNKVKIKTDFGKILDRQVNNILVQ